MLRHQGSGVKCARFDASHTVRPPKTERRGVSHERASGAPRRECFSLRWGEHGVGKSGGHTAERLQVIHGGRMFVHH